MAGTIVAAFGHAWLRDQSFGLQVVQRLREHDLPDDVHLADWSFGTLTAYQKLAFGSYDRGIFLNATEREDCLPGTLSVQRPQIVLPPEEEIHRRIVDCVMGAVSVDHLLVIAAYYGTLPRDVLLIEARPLDDTWGRELSPAVAGLVDSAVNTVLAEIPCRTA